MGIKGAIFDLDGTILDSMSLWRRERDFPALIKAYNSTLVLKDGAREFLDKLRENNVRMALATATDRFMVEPALKRNNIFDYFEVIFTCSEVGAKKLEPLIYEKALDFLGLDKSEVLVFEDAPYAVKTAKEAGFTVVGVFDGWEEDISGDCDVYIKSWSESDKIIL